MTPVGYRPPANIKRCFTLFTTLLAVPPTPQSHALPYPTMPAVPKAVRSDSCHSTPNLPSTARQSSAKLCTGACPPPLATAARRSPGQGRTEPAIHKEAFCNLDLSSVKKMGMDVLTGQEAPGGIPEPAAKPRPSAGRRSSPGVLGGGSYPAPGDPGSEGYL